MRVYYTESARAPCIRDTKTDSVHVRSICPTPNMKQLKFNWQFHSKYNRQKYQKKNTTVNAVQNNRQSAVKEVQIQTCYCMNEVYKALNTLTQIEQTLIEQTLIKCLEKQLFVLLFTHMPCISEQELTMLLCSRVT